MKFGELKLGDLLPYINPMSQIILVKWHTEEDFYTRNFKVIKYGYKKDLLDYAHYTVRINGIWYDGSENSLMIGI